MDYRKWGIIEYEKDNFIIVAKKKSKLKYYITIFDQSLEVDVMLNNKIFFFLI